MIVYNILLQLDTSWLRQMTLLLSCTCHDGGTDSHAPPFNRSAAQRRLRPPARSKVKERVDAKNAFDGYVHSMRSATEGSGDNKGLSEKMDSVPLAG